MSELFDKEVNAQKESLKKYFRGLRKLPQAHEKVCDENETKKQTKKQRNKEKKTMCALKGFWWKEALYKARAQRTGENDLDKLQANDSGYNEGTICLVNG